MQVVVVVDPAIAAAGVEVEVVAAPEAWVGVDATSDPPGAILQASLAS